MAGVRGAVDVARFAQRAQAHEDRDRRGCEIARPRESRSGPARTLRRDAREGRSQGRRGPDPRAVHGPEARDRRAPRGASGSTPTSPACTSPTRAATASTRRRSPRPQAPARNDGLPKRSGSSSPTPRASRSPTSRRRRRRPTPWDGVRNYQARNFLRDEVKVGDDVLFYHSSSDDETGVVGTAVVSRAAYPDFTAFDPTHDHFDPDSEPGRSDVVPRRRQAPVDVPAVRDARDARRAPAAPEDVGAAPRQPAFDHAGEQGRVGRRREARGRQKSWLSSGAGSGRLGDRTRRPPARQGD